MQTPLGPIHQPDGSTNIFNLHEIPGFTADLRDGDIHQAGLLVEENYTGEYTFFSYIPGVRTVERFLHWWHVASRASR
jgi:hypothetical protein